MTDQARARPLVLLVEDDKDSREMYAMGLDMFGLRVAAAASAAEALRHAERERPDVIVTDLTLPDMDGLDLCEALRQGSGARVPIVVLTGRSAPEDRERADAAGVERLIVKPCPPDELVDAIHALLSS